MPDYALAQIYTIRSKTDKDFLHVGSTCRDLAAVMVKKNCDRKKGRHKSNKLFNKVAEKWEDFYLQLVQVLPC